MLGKGLIRNLAQINQNWSIEKMFSSEVLIFKSIVKAIDTIGNLVILASVELNDEVLSALLQGIKDKINLIIKSPIDFSSFLIFLNANQCKLICDVLKAELMAIIKAGIDFSEALYYLSLEQCKVVCEALKAELPVIIKNAEDFFNILYYLESAQHVVVYEVLKEKFSAMCKNDKNVFKDLYSLSFGQPRCVRNFLNSMHRSSAENLVSAGVFRNTPTNPINQTMPEAASTSGLQALRP